MIVAWRGRHDMLALSRRVGETIVIGEGDRAVTVTVVEVRGNKVRLAIAAPHDVAIDRAEVHEEYARRRAQEGRP